MQHRVTFLSKVELRLMQPKTLISAIIQAHVDETQKVNIYLVISLMTTLNQTLENSKNLCQNYYLITFVQCMDLDSSV